MSAPEPAKQPSELTLRVVAGIALIAIATIAIFLGGMAFWLLCAVLSVFMMAEWADLAKVPPKTKRLAQYALFVPIAIFCPWAAGPNFFALGLLLGAAFFITIVTRMPMLGAGTIYCGLPVFALLLIREAPDNGIVYAFWTLALVWATDVGAYFAGRAIGGPKLAPAISPNKTWAGLAGGVVAAALFGGAMNHTFGLPVRLALASPLLAVLAQAGDLYESWLKRRAGVKDSGDILPGHGGVLDRLDGLVPVAPIAALLVLIVTAG